MDTIVVKLLEKRGVSRFHKIEGLDIPYQLYGYLEGTVFHICGDDLNDKALDQIFSKRYIIIEEREGTWHFSVNNTYAENDKALSTVLIDTSTGDILSFPHAYCVSPNGCYLFSGFKKWTKSINTLGSTLHPDYEEAKEYYHFIINDIEVHFDWICYVIGNWQYVLTAFPYTLYGRTGKKIMEIPDGYGCVGLISFGGGKFQLLFLNEEKETTIVYSSKTRKQVLLNQAINPNEVLVDNGIALLLTKNYRHYDHDFWAIDDIGDLIEQGYIEGNNITFQNGIISYIDSGQRYFRDLANNVSGECGRYENRVVLSRTVPDPWNTIGTKKLCGVLNLNTNRMILPFCYDHIITGKGDVLEYDSDCDISESIKTFNYSIVYQTNNDGEELSGLYIDNKLEIPLSICEIKQIEIFRDGHYHLLDYFWVSEASGRTFIFAPYKDIVECDSYSFESTLLLWKNGLAAIFSCGKLISDFKYSMVTKAPRGYYYVYSVKGIGLFHRERGEVFPPEYESLKVRCKICEENEYVIADSKLFSTNGKLLFNPNFVSGANVVYVFDDYGFKVIVGNNVYDESQQLCFDAEKNGVSFRSYSYGEGIYAFERSSGGYLFMNSEFEEMIEGKDYLCKGNRICFENVYFNKLDDGFHDLYDREEEYRYEEDIDYEEQTYYALGGDDYERFKENGGSIDDMMDGIGF